MSTKYRRKVLKAGIGEYIQRKIKQISGFHPEIEIVEVNTDIDHIHVLASIPPRFSVSQIVGMIKANTGGAMRKKFLFLDKVYWGVKGIWSRGYFVSTVGIMSLQYVNMFRCRVKKTAGKRSLNSKMPRP